MESTPDPHPTAPRGYVRTVGPKLRIVLVSLLVSFAILTATGAYLFSVFLLELFTGETYTQAFTLWMLLGHILLGVVMVVPFLAFGMSHWLVGRKRTNKRAIRLGLMLFGGGVLSVITGLLLIQLEGFPQLPTDSSGRHVVYALHLLFPVAAFVLYVWHRKAGPKIRWRWVYVGTSLTTVSIVALLALHTQTPHRWFAEGPKEGAQYFFPSEARTSDGKFISAETLMMDDYCLKCHADIYGQWFHSAHHFSSFNNPPYLFSVMETRKVSLERDGDVQASRWCAGCHDPVPFFSGRFDDPEFDVHNDPTAHAGVTCTVCHAMTHVHGPIGNAAYTIEEPQHYPFASSDDPFAQWINNQLVKAKPDFHKKTFLKPFHKSAEFCSVCHKVNLPPALTHYREFQRGQNHYDSFLVSGVSGHGARSFYYPKIAKENCSSCHMPLVPSEDFGSRDFDGSGVRKVHDHLFPGANTGLFDLLARSPRYGSHAPGFERAIEKTEAFLKDSVLRIDLFGLKEGGTTGGQLIAPLRPELPVLEPGKKYLVEVVIRTLGVGHHFTQGTADSNEIWVDFHARSGGKTIGRSGAISGENESEVDEWSHFVNVLMLDRHGNKVDRRNAQDIFTPLYNHQMPPGTGQVVHYELDVPEDVTDPIEIEVRLRFRKFTYHYMKLVHNEDGKQLPVPNLPIVDLCSDRVLLPVRGADGASSPVPDQVSPISPAWQRWNDYGIGCLLEGGPDEKQGELRQAEEAFKHLVTSGPAEAITHGYVNLARVYLALGQLDEAAVALTRAKEAESPANWWTLAWFNALVTLENATEAEDFDAAIANLERIVDPKNRDPERNFDFSKDYVVLAKLGEALYYRTAQESSNSPSRLGLQTRAIDALERALALDPEQLEGHFWLSKLYPLLVDESPDADSSRPAPEHPAELIEIAKQLQEQASASERIRDAGWLAQSAVTLGQKPLDPRHPRLPAFLEVAKNLRAAHRDEQDDRTRSALAFALGEVHREIHLMLKPDETARAQAASIYRQKHPAANHAAGAVVIYRTNRFLEADQ